MEQSSNPRELAQRFIAPTIRKVVVTSPLKVIADTFALGPDRLARFTREAQVLASLDHSHLAAIR